MRIGPVICPTRKLRGCNRCLSSSSCENRAPKLSTNSTQPSGRIRSGCTDCPSLSSVQKHSTKLLSGDDGFRSLYRIAGLYQPALLHSPGSEISLCNLCVLCVSVVDKFRAKHTTETQRTQRLHREISELGLLRQSPERVYDVPPRYRRWY